MLAVRCQSCRASFETPVHAAGNIEYERCKQVFRVVYRYRTPCPRCRKILQLAPAGREGVVGVPLPEAAADPTERWHVSETGDATLAATSSEAPEDPPPTVRVTRPGRPQKKEKPFRYIEKPRQRPRPLHVALRAPRRSPLPLAKILLGAVILAGTSLAILLTSLALRSPPPAPAGSERKSPAPADLHPPRAEPGETLPQGGPADDSLAAENFGDAQAAAGEFSGAQEESPAHPLGELRLPRVDRLTAGFGPRPDPFTRKERFHGGLDIAGEKRSEVKAALTGTVKFVGSRGGYGKVVVLSHKDGYETLYGHLEKPLVRKGERLQRGDLVGLLGSSGRSTGPHVHFELHRNGTKVDPIRAKLMAGGS